MKEVLAELKASTGADAGPSPAAVHAISLPSLAATLGITVADLSTGLQHASTGISESITAAPADQIAFEMSPGSPERNDWGISTALISLATRMSHIERKHTPKCLLQLGGLPVILSLIHI